MTNSKFNALINNAEECLQSYLANRPPPFYIQRKLDFQNIPSEERLSFLKSVFPTVQDTKSFELSCLCDAISCTQRDDIACLNRYFYQREKVTLDQVVQLTRDGLYQARACADNDAIYCLSEILGYALVETCLWEYLTQPFVVLKYDRSLIQESQQLLDEAFNVARDKRDWLRWHRITANQARLGFLVVDKSEALPLKCDAAIALGQFCLNNRIAIDNCFYTRRDELLHITAIIKLAFGDPYYLNLMAHIKSPARIKPQTGMVRMTLETKGFIANISLPLITINESVLKQHGQYHVYFDIIGLEDRAQLVRVYKGKSQSLSVPFKRLHFASGLDMLFRPNHFRESLETLERRKADEREYHESWSIPGKYWLFKYPIEIVGFDVNKQLYHHLSNPTLTGSQWELAFGNFIKTHISDLDDMKHIILSPDGPLALLPLHLSLIDENVLLCDKYSVSYAPSIAYYAPADPLPKSTLPKISIIINSTNRLRGPVWEVQRMQNRLGKNNVTILDKYDGSLEQLERTLSEMDILHIATHGYTFSDTPEKTGLQLHKDRILTIREIQTLNLKKGCLVFLNACGSNKINIRSRIDFSSIANAFLAAGATTVIATFWETDDLAAALISDRFFQHLIIEKRERLFSLNQAINWIRTADRNELESQDLGKLAIFLPLQKQRPYSSPYYWGSFALFGCW